jgi:hypothetical protein
MSRYYSGPVSDHFSGERFFDPHGVPPRSRRELNRWLVDRYRRGTKAKWPAWAPWPYADRPPPRVDGTGCRISYVGHASFLLQTAGLNVLLDPVWSPRASPFRHVGPKRAGIVFADLPPIDLVLVTHAHYDHLDVVTLSRLARPIARWSSRRWSCAIMIRRWRPKRTIGTIGSRSIRT